MFLTKICFYHGLYSNDVLLYFLQNFILFILTLHS